MLYRNDIMRKLITILLIVFLPVLVWAAGSKTINIPGSASSATNYHVELTLHYGSGTDAGKDVYLAGLSNTDFSDVRFKQNSTYLDYWIKQEADSNYADIIVLLPSISAAPTITPISVTWGETTSSNTLKIGLVSDIHYGSADQCDGLNCQCRTQSLTWLDSFKTQMRIFNPRIVINCGDNSTAVNSGEKTSLLSAIVSSLDGLIDSDTDVVYCLGNHDFEYATAAEVRAVLSPSHTYFVSGKLYGSYDIGNYHVVVLDANYADTTPFAHFSEIGGIGHGYIPDGANGSDIEMSWLTSDLAGTSKPTIVLCHQSLPEWDASTFYTVPTNDFDRHSVTNRSTVRSVLEASQKVVMVLEGHQHFSRWTSIKGIPYIDIPSLNAIAPYPYRLLNSNKGIWSTLQLDDLKHEITINTYEDDSVNGVQLAATGKIYYKSTTGETTSYHVNNPYEVFANAYSAGIGSSSTGGSDFTGIGALTEWTVVTDTVNYAPVDVILAISNGNGLMVQGGSTSKAGSATRRFSSQSGIFKFGFKVKKTDTTKTVTFELTDGTTAGPYISFSSAGITCNGLTILQSYSSSTWYYVDLIVNCSSHTYDIFVDGVQLAGSVPFYGSVSTLDRFVVVRPASQKFTVYLDGIYLQQYQLSGSDVLRSTPAIFSGPTTSKGH